MPRTLLFCFGINERGVKRALDVATSCFNIAHAIVRESCLLLLCAAAANSFGSRENAFEAKTSQFTDRVPFLAYPRKWTTIANPA